MDVVDGVDVVDLLADAEQIEFFFYKRLKLNWKSSGKRCSELFVEGPKTKLK